MISDDKQLYGALSVYRERGYFLRRLEHLQKAKAAHDEAFNCIPDNVRNLLGRSRVCIEAIQPENAFADAELALQLHPGNMTARNMQARALYTMSEFERSIVMNYRGLSRRKQPPYFKEGLNQGLETIQDCIGLNAGNILLNLFPIIKQQEALNTKRSTVYKSLHKCRIPQSNTQKSMSQMEAKHRVALARIIAMKYLGAMSSDKFFLEELLEDRRIKSANSRGSAEVQNLVKQALSALTECQAVLRSQRPYCNVKVSEITASRYQNKFKQAILEDERRSASRMCDKLLRELEICVKKHNMIEFISKTERLQTYLDSKTNKILPEKDIYLDRLYRIVGEGYLSQHRLSYTISERSNRRRIAFLMGLPVCRPSSFDSVVANYSHKVIDKNIAIAKLKSTLDMCKNPFMKCWILYELARLFSSQKAFSNSKFYAKQCQSVAQHISSVTWWLNGCFVLMSADMQQGNSHEVRSQVEEAYQWSRRMQDPEQVQAFLRKCAQMAAETKPADDRKLVIQREKDILSVMDEEQRINSGVLFKRMSTVPRGRRFEVFPQNMHLGNTKSERHKLKQKGLTVIPGAVRSLNIPPKSKVAGFQTFDL